jgi:hypothetical protein
MEGGEKNLVASSEKDNQGGNGSRLGGLLEAPANASSLGLELMMLTLIGSKSGKYDRIVTSSLSSSKCPS